MNRLAFARLGGLRTPFAASLSLWGKQSVRTMTTQGDSKSQETLQSKHAMKISIEQIRSVLRHESFTSGTCKVPVEHCDLYYKSSSSEYSKSLNLAKATEKELSQLISTCDAAPFGRGNENVLDESYRKALKLDLSQFSMPFELANTEILQKIQQDLVETDVALQRRIRAEPYKLNIYDKGAFFKSHQDTPRAENMFGSLVVVFPTPHEGGDFTLSSGTEKWSFDSASMLAGSTPDAPEVAYIAFYSDIMHEVLPVTSGCRITLTYNLYFETSANLPVAKTTEKYNTVRNMVKDIVDNPVAFPANGVLCFGLSHQYPLRRDKQYRDTDEIKPGKIAHSLAELAPFLKGSDALIHSVCKDLGLHVAVKAFYFVEDDYVWLMEHYFASNFIEDLDYALEDMHDLYERPGLQKITGLQKISEAFGDDSESEDASGSGKDDSEDSDDTYESRRVVWVTDMTTHNRVPTAYIAYGNEAALGYVYGETCLVVQRSEPEL